MSKIYRICFKNKGNKEQKIHFERDIELDDNEWKKTRVPECERKMMQTYN